MDKLLAQIGQLFVISYKGETPNAAFEDFLAEENIGGIILFADNCRTQQMIRESVARLTDLLSTPPLVAIDQEGGRVSRIKGVPAEIAAPSTYAEHNNLERFSEDYRRSCVLLDSLGINLNLAPVADVGVNPKHACLRDRTFGSTAPQVSGFVQMAVQVAKEVGLLSCAKHFPGLGPSDQDPHKSRTTIAYDALEWQQRDREPFATAIDAGVDLIMTTHVHLNGYDDTIATGSSRIVTEMLRNDLGFDGPVVTDDLLMKGAAELGNIGDRAVKAIQAGHDLLLFGQELDSAMRAYDVVVDAARRGDIEERRLQNAIDRVQGLKYRIRRAEVR